MATIKQPILDILTKLSTLQVKNADGNLVNLYARIWNKQNESELKAKLYDFPKPAAFVEVVTGAVYEQLGYGYISVDLSFRIHLIHEFYNEENAFEQDLYVFDLRDVIICLMSLYCPTGCGPLTVVNEGHDYDHGNLYHYTIDMACNFTDSAGNTEKDYIKSEPPQQLIINPPTIKTL